MCARGYTKNHGARIATAAASRLFGKDTWAGKCQCCGAIWKFLPRNDEGVCALCGAFSVIEISAKEAEMAGQ